VAEMAARLRLEVIGVDDAKAAVVDSDIVVTSGPVPPPGGRSLL